jgi:hypothetical protein
MTRFVLISNPESPRTTGFQDALTELGLSPACVIPWLDLLEGRAHLDEIFSPGDTLRIESPGRNFNVERALLMRGADEPETESEIEYASIAADAARTLEFQKGEILYPRQWYRGFCAVLRDIKEAIAQTPDVRTMSDPDEITEMFDKPGCNRRLLDASVPAPFPLEMPVNFNDLWAQMNEWALPRIFAKFAHGSSASGTVAYRTDRDGERHQAYTTVEQNGYCLYNSRRVRCLNDLEEIRGLVDALAPHRLHAEEWLPKATMPGKGVFDVRALAIDGKMRHVIGRCSETPMTNLHLLNTRVAAEVVRERVGERAWAMLGETVERVAKVYPRSLHLGIDIMWTPGFRQCYVLEVNAFGDQLNDVLSEGETTYTAEIRAWSEKWGAKCAER